MMGKKHWYTIRVRVCDCVGHEVDCLPYPDCENCQAHKQYHAREEDDEERE